MREKTMMPTPPARMAPVLHPAAQEAAAAYSDALNKAAGMESELRELRILYEAAKRHIALLEKENGEWRHRCGTYERYAVAMTTSLDGISRTIDAAKQQAVELAKEQPPAPPPQVPQSIVDNLERELAEAAAVIDARKDP